MDPTQTLTDMLIALDKGELDHAENSLKALNRWLAGGGFVPNFAQAFAKMNTYLASKSVDHRIAIASAG